MIKLNNKIIYSTIGAFFGICFPIIGTAIDFYDTADKLTYENNQLMKFINNL